LSAIRDLAGFRASSLAANDDASAPSTALGFPVNYFGTMYSAVFPNNNGNITFTSGQVTYTPYGLTGGVPQPIIAAFFADVDTRAAGSSLMTYGQDVVDGLPCFGLDWLGVGYFNSRADKLNRFQLLLISRADVRTGDFDIEFNYEQIRWETGDASGGAGGLGGQSAHAGYSSGSGQPGTFYELPGSGIPGAFLDGGPSALAAHSLGSDVPGRYRFQVRNGVVYGRVAPPTGLAGQGHCDGSVSLTWNAS